MVMAVAVILLSCNIQVFAEGNESQGEFTVCLDPGHCDGSTGAQSHGYGEEDLVLEIAKYCKEELEKNGVRVIMTREDETCPAKFPVSDHDLGICLAKRVDIARDNNADIFVSLHLNASDVERVHGAEVHCANMNFRPELGKEGQKLGQDIQDELVNLGLFDRGLKVQDSSDEENIYPDGSRRDRLKVIRMSKEYGFPGVLVEHAFITSTSDVNEYLSTEEGLKALGIADAKGILKYKEQYPGKMTYDNGWLYTERGWVYVDNDGLAVKGWLFVNGYWYYMNEKGVMQTGWQLVNDHWYYMHSDGHMGSDWIYDNYTWYHMDSSGAMQTGWQLINDYWYYMDDSGAMVTGWKWINDECYYLYPDGHMAADETLEDGSYVNSSGAWTWDKWIQDSIGWWYSYKEGGYPKSEFKEINGATYYFDKTGYMVTGWNDIDGNRYYMDNSGAVAKGWKFVDGYWYYMDETGVKQTGWQEIDGIHYYLNEKGQWEEDMEYIPEEQEKPEGGTLDEKTNNFISSSNVIITYRM